MSSGKNLLKPNGGNFATMLIVLCISFAVLAIPGIAQKPGPENSKPVAKKVAATQAGSSGISTYAKEKKESDTNIKVDNRLDKSEKQAYEEKAQQGDKFAQEQANAINKVPGVNVTSHDLKEAEVKKGPSVNPIAWLFKPVIRLQEQSVRLEQQIMKLSGPIAALQPGMLGLENRMTHVQKQMVNMGGQIDSVENKMGDVRGQMAGMQKDISAMRVELGQIKQPITDLKGPIMQLHDPLIDIQKPVSIVGTKLESLDKQLADLKTLISLVLTAIFVSAGIIAVGTPIAAILIWRNKGKFLPKAKPEEAKEEANINRAGKAMDRQLG